MKSALLLSVGVVLLTTGLYAAPNALLGTWRLDSQEVNGQKSDSESLTLKITQDGDKLAFAFSVPVNNVYFVSATYTVKLDGSEADVKNAKGDKVGTVQITSGGPSEYKLILKRPNGPDSSGRLMVSPDGKTLTSEQNTVQAGPGGRSIHSKQLFSHY